jgi:hypothetical protein
MTAPPATTGTTGIPTTIATSAATGTTALTGTGTTTKTVTFGNQKITLTTPSDSVCLAPSGAAAVSFITAAVKGSKATALKFRSAGIYLDRGVKHSAKVKEHGKSGSKTVISYSPNATLRRTSDEFSLSLKGLAMGAHTLRVYITYSETVTTAKAHGNERARTVTSTKTVTRSLSAAIEVC